MVGCMIWLTCPALPCTAPCPASAGSHALPCLALIHLACMPCPALTVVPHLFWLSFSGTSSWDCRYLCSSGLPNFAVVAQLLGLILSRLSSLGCDLSGFRDLKASVARVVLLLLLTAFMIYNDRKHC